MIVALATALSLSAGCKQESKSGETGTEVVVQVPSSLTSAKAEIEKTLGSYEKVRAQLAADQIEPIAGPAGELAGAATGAAAKAPANLRAPLQKLGETASYLEQMPKDDASAVRKAFGEVSQALIGLLTAEPALQKGLHVFECPMAQGYKQWVQPNEKLENPYMGKSMLECGTPGQWK
jgi:Cu(I)/Ag(I) efflux system membrane fusion protein